MAELKLSDSTPAVGSWIVPAHAEAARHAIAAHPENKCPCSIPNPLPQPWQSCILWSRSPAVESTRWGAPARDAKGAGTGTDGSFGGCPGEFLHHLSELDRKSTRLNS